MCVAAILTPVAADIATERCSQVMENGELDSPDVAAVSSGLSRFVGAGAAAW